MNKMPSHTESSGNVFADLGLSNAPEMQAKADLAWAISQIIEEQDLSQAEAGELLGIDQPKVSALLRGRLSGFSLERLYRFLNALGKDIEIVVRTPAARRSSPGVHVIVAGRKRVPRKVAAKKSSKRRGLATG